MLTACGGAKDPVVMSVNGADVLQSEFEYLYHKNLKQQQLQQQSFDDYVEQFKLYRIKVEEARQAGIDTTAAFRTEMEKYRHELALPYLTDSVYLNKLAHTAYDRLGQEVEAAHIMYFKTPDAAENARNRAKLDSIRQVIAAGGDFAQMAREYSQDRGSASRGGVMGYITSLQYPYSFETAVYETPEGKVSDLFETSVGYHIVKGGKHRPARGQVRAAHILRLTQGKSAQEAKEAETLIDSLYNEAVKNPDGFAKLATKYSEDPGSGANGGELPWFGSGEMVAEFDSVAFALNPGEISKPFRTSYGWHFIKKLDSRGVAPFESRKAEIMRIIQNPQDDRARMIRQNQSANLARLNKGVLNAKTIDALRGYVSANGIDSVLVADYTGAKGGEVLFTIGKVATPVSELVAPMANMKQPAGEVALGTLNAMVEALYNQKLVNAEEDRLMKVQPAYRNLMNEYHDGSLLYEISSQNVWGKAAQDEAGQRAYFEAHRGDYKFNAPKAKGFLVQTVNDSVAALIRQAAVEIPAEDMVKTLRKMYGKQISVDRVLADKGQNKMIDYLLFDGPVAQAPRANFPVFFMLNPRVIDAPEEYADVRGMVAGDYQDQLQKEWEAALRSKYAVKVNDKVLKKIKR